MQVPPFWRWMVRPRQLLAITGGVVWTYVIADMLRSGWPASEPILAAFILGAVWAFGLFVTIEHIPDYDAIGEDGVGT